MSPKGREGANCAPSSFDPIADLLAEIEREPELANQHRHSRSRAAALERLEQAALVAQVLFEDSLDDGKQRYARRQLFDDLWLYAWPVIKAFLRTNRMTQVVRRYDPAKYVRVRPEDQVVLRASEEERDALAIDVIARAVRDFDRNALTAGRWDPRRGASLRTYFIGTCALNFRNAYRMWSKKRGERLDRVAHHRSVDLDLIGDKVASLAPDLATTAAQRIAVRKLIDMAQPQTKLILGLLLLDLTYGQIATELGMTAGAVEQRIRRFTRRAQRRQDLASLAADLLGVGTRGPAPDVVENVLDRQDPVGGAA